MKRRTVAFLIVTVACLVYFAHRDGWNRAIEYADAPIADDVAREFAASKPPGGR